MEITIVKSKLDDPKFGERPRYRVLDHAVTEAAQVDKNTRVEFSFKNACAAAVLMAVKKAEPCSIKILEVKESIPDPDSIVNRTHAEVKEAEAPALAESK